MDCANVDMAAKLDRWLVQAKFGCGFAGFRVVFLGSLDFRVLFSDVYSLYSSRRRVEWGSMVFSITVTSPVV